MEGQGSLNFRGGQQNSQSSYEGLGSSSTIIEPLPNEFDDAQSATTVPVQDGINKHYAKVHPSYLATLGHDHAEWAFGAIAELVDNARDAKAKRIDISIQLLNSEEREKGVPILSIMDNGRGMSHIEIMRLVSLGCEQPDSRDPDRIGRFGIGFKAGTMALGRDALVLTQTTTTRSILFLSQTFNSEKGDMEIPVVSLGKHGNCIEGVCTTKMRKSLENLLEAVEAVSPFNEYMIKQKFELFGEEGTGTQIFVWNLKQWGSNFILETSSKMNRKNIADGQEGDIMIPSRRVRSRVGQISLQVPLDYSLHAYLEVMYLDPRMEIYVQGSQVKHQLWTTKLTDIHREKGDVMGQTMQLIIGTSQIDCEKMNCGIFLYWRGRLIEAYKRVGDMIHTPKLGHGVIGIVDVTSIMENENGKVSVLLNKQGFCDCEAYIKLEEWLGKKIDDYLEKRTKSCQSEIGWIECNGCHKWRMLRLGDDMETISTEWFCYMPPFNGKCEPLEQESFCGTNKTMKNTSANVNSTGKRPRSCATSRDQGNQQANEEQSMLKDDEAQPKPERLRRGPPRRCKMRRE